MIAAGGQVQAVRVKKANHAGRSKEGGSDSDWAVRVINSNAKAMIEGHRVRRNLSRDHARGLKRELLRSLDERGRIGKGYCVLVTYLVLCSIMVTGLVPAAHISAEFELGEAMRGFFEGVRFGAPTATKSMSDVSNFGDMFDWIDALSDTINHPVDYSGQDRSAADRAMVLQFNKVVAAVFVSYKRGSPKQCGLRNSDFYPNGLCVERPDESVGMRIGDLGNLTEFDGVETLLDLTLRKGSQEIVYSLDLMTGRPAPACLASGAALAKQGVHLQCGNTSSSHIQELNGQLRLMGGKASLKPYRVTPLPFGFTVPIIVVEGAPVRVAAELVASARRNAVLRDRMTTEVTAHMLFLNGQQKLFGQAAAKFSIADTGAFSTSIETETLFEEPPVEVVGATVCANLVMGLLTLKIFASICLLALGVLRPRMFALDRLDRPPQLNLGWCLQMDLVRPSLAGETIDSMLLAMMGMLTAKMRDLFNPAGNLITQLNVPEFDFLRDNAGAVEAMMAFSAQLLEAVMEKKTFERYTIVFLFLTVVRLFSLTNFQPHLAVMNKTIMNSALALQHWFFLYIMTIILLATAGHFAFGSDVQNYAALFPQSHTAGSIQTMILASVGDFDVHAILQLNWGSTFVFVSIFLCTLLLLNMFLAIVIDVFMDAKAAAAGKPFVTSELAGIFRQQLPHWLPGAERLLWSDVRHFLLNEHKSDEVSMRDITVFFASRGATTKDVERAFEQCACGVFYGELMTPFNASFFRSAFKNSSAFNKSVVLNCDEDVKAVLSELQQSNASSAGRLGVFESKLSGMCRSQDKMAAHFNNVTSQVSALVEGQERILRMLEVQASGSVADAGHLDRKRTDQNLVNG